MANCVGNVPRGLDTGLIFHAPTHLAEAISRKCMRVRSHLGGLCNDRVSRFTMNLVTKVSSYLGHTLRGVQVAV